MGKSRLEKAVQMAYKAHRGQLRDGPQPLPYITHPIDVLNWLRYVGGEIDETALCAAALHDTLEETDLSESKIEAKVGADVLALVKELTRTEPSKSETKDLSEEEVWLLRSRILLDEIHGMSPIAKKVKLADRCSNLSTGMKTRTGEWLARYLKQSEWILQRIDRSISPELWDAIAEMVKNGQPAAT